MTARKEGKVSDTPTPRTDAQEFIPVHECGCFPPYPTVSSGFARQLERELAEARDRIDDLTATRVHSCCNECKRPNCVLRRELTEARESEASEARWAAQYKQQRDALAVALRGLMFDCLRFRIEPSDDAYKNAESSLATLEGRGSNPAQKSPPTTP
jgi:hypothetical protein